MVYSRRFGAIIPVASFIASVLVTWYLAPHLPSREALVITALLLFVAVWFVVYCANLILIDRFDKAEVEKRLRLRWEHRLKMRLQGRSVDQPIDDYVDRVARLRMMFCKPRIIEDVLADITRSERESRLAVEEERRLLLAKNDLCAFVKVMANRWRTSATPSPKEWRVIDDPIHGCLVLEEPLATLLAHPMLQRLNRVRQLSFSYAQFPSSNHSRLSHCLGVARNVERALAGILDRGVFYVVGDGAPRPFPREVIQNRAHILQKGKVVALLHDLGHGPFGHALDNYIGFSNLQRSNPDPDKVYTSRYITSYLTPTLSQLGFKPQEIVNILEPSERFTLAGFDVLIGELVDSPLDVDRMDFLVRDAHMTGLSMGFTNAEALIENVRPVLDEGAYTLAFDEAAIGYMEHFLYAREGMYRNCYEHPRKRAAERIFERLIREIAEDASLGISEEDLYALADEDIICALRLAGSGSERRSRLLGELLGDLDYVVVHDVGIREEGSAAAAWASGATKGRTGDLKLRYILQPAQWEESIAQASIGMERVAQIQVVVPPLSAYSTKFSAARILRRRFDKYSVEEFFRVSDQAQKALAEMNRARARLKVMCPNAFTSAEKESVKRAASQELGGQ
jgi:HD superfamily phosphohydrolase